MIKRFLAFAFAVLFFGCTFGQGYSLVFNRVIDTAIAAEITSCIDISGAGYTGGAITVPSGKVWKIESIGPLGYNTTTVYLYNNCTGTSSTYYYTIWDVKVDDGSIEKGYLKRRMYYNSVWNVESIDGIAWLRSGTSVSCHMNSSSATYKFTYDASPASPVYCRVHLTIIEFLLVPN
jgi:hypothetical protein